MRTLTIGVTVGLFVGIGVHAVLGAETKALGTFTAAGKTIQIHNASVARYVDPDDADTHYVEVLMSDVPIETADRGYGRLAELATAGKLHALRFLWQEGVDSITFTPYDERVAESGKAVTGAGLVDLQAYDEKHLKAQFSSHRIGQDWQFNVRLEGDVRDGGTLPEQPTAVALSDLLRAGSADEKGKADPARRIKIDLGAMGYEFTVEGFRSAVLDFKVDAVKLFLKGGMSPDTRDSEGAYVLSLATTFCASKDADAGAEIVRTLVAAGAKVNVKDDNNATPVLNAVSGCPLVAIEALIKAGADVNAKAKGGATPLMMAEAMNRPDVAAALRKAGAKPWK